MILNKKTKNIIWVVAGAGILILAIALLLGRGSGTMSEKDTAFAIADSAAVNRIFLANTLGDKVLLERTEQGWIVNKKYAAMPANVNNLLNCLLNISIKYPVAKAARQNVSKRMSSNAVKVEVYFTDYRIKIGSLKWLKYTNSKVYYIGTQTMDNMGNFAKLENSKVPVVVYLPGFRGFIGAKYSPYEDDWKSHLIADLRLIQIQEVRSIDWENKDNSFAIRRSGQRYFDIIALSAEERLPEYDTLRMLDFLSELRNLNYEFGLAHLSQSRKDSIFANKFKEITITDTSGITTKIEMYHLENVIDTTEYDYTGLMIDPFSKDKFYAVINDDKENIVLCQFFAFDRLVQPLEYFILNSKIIPLPKLFDMDN
ncbi:MAG: hypothetical protein LBR36_08795 [Bacteroidales bacterium]|jgi:hypothetical protein|nr:hypothetical protein [Bacteroidales bacterium]